MKILVAIFSLIILLATWFISYRVTITSLKINTQVGDGFIYIQDYTGNVNAYEERND